MTNQERLAIQARVSETFHSAGIRCSNVWATTTEVSVELSADTDYNYDKLSVVAAALGTTDISFYYSGETAGYSDVTPGDPAYLSITIKGIK